MKTIAKFFVVALLLGSTATATFASPLAGPQTNLTRVSARSADVYHVTLRSGETTTISIAGDGDTDLDLYVYDSTGRLVVSGIGLTDRESVWVRPGYSDTFRVEVRNLGNVWNQYRIDMR